MRELTFRLNSKLKTQNYEDMGILTQNSFLKTQNYEDMGILTQNLKLKTQNSLKKAGHIKFGFLL